MADEITQTNLVTEKSNEQNQKLTKDIAEVKYNFTITQMIGITSFIGTAIVTIGYAFYSYLTTVESVKKLDTSYKEFNIKVDTLNNAINRQGGEIQMLKDLFQKTKELPPANQ